MSASFVHPKMSLRIPDKVEKPGKEGETVSAAQSEPMRVRDERVPERSGVVVDLADGICNELRHGGRILLLIQ
jgi:hypothetical protein